MLGIIRQGVQVSNGWLYYFSIVLFLLQSFKLVLELFPFSESLQLPYLVTSTIAAAVSLVIFTYILVNLPAIVLVKSNQQYLNQILITNLYKSGYTNSEKRYKEIERLTQSSTWYWDMRTSTFSFSGGIESMLERTGKRYSVTELKSLIKEEDKALFNDFVSNLKSLDKQAQVHVRFVTDSGEKVFQFSTSKIEISEGKEEAMVSGVGLLCDITEMSNVLAAFKNSKELLQEVSYFQSHTVRGQVATILGLAQLFNCDDYQDASNKKVIEGIIVSAQNLDRHIKEVSHQIGVIDK